MLEVSPETRGARVVALKSLAPGYFARKNKGMPEYPKKLCIPLPGFEIKELLHESDHSLIVRAEEPAA